VPVADVLERLLPAQLLIARLDVDLGVGLADGDVVVQVQVAPIDLNVHAAEIVDERLEALEVDVDDVIDLDPQHLLDRLDRQLRAAERVGGVDLLGARRAMGGMDRHLQVAGDREHRRVGLGGVEADQEHGVRVSRGGGVDRARRTFVRPDQQDRLRTAGIGGGELVAEVQLRAQLEGVGERLHLEQDAGGHGRGGGRDHQHAAEQHPCPHAATPESAAA